MTQVPAVVIASRDEDVEVLSNFDRLRSYLKADSLALALLETWEGARTDGVEGARAMMDALQNFHNIEQVEDEQSTAEEN
jgi:hypothetical protein